MFLFDCVDEIIEYEIDDDDIMWFGLVFIGDFESVQYIELFDILVYVMEYWKVVYEDCEG